MHIHYIIGDNFTMSPYTWLIIGLFLSVVNGQTCQGTYNQNLVGYCEVSDRCRGTALTPARCELRRCCINGTTTFPSTPICLKTSSFTALYNSTRGTYLANIFNNGFNQAGICNNCQAQAAFLAIAATMTNNFEFDEVPGAPSSFSVDDGRYGNNQTGDGSRFRRRGFFGLRGRTMYERAARILPQYQLLNNSENAAISNIAIAIAAQLWRNPDLQGGQSLNSLADGTFYGFSLLWYRFTGDIDQLAEAVQYYSTFLRLFECGGDLYPGQGNQCQYNATHSGYCIPECIQGLEEAGEWCGCVGERGPQCPNSPAHIRCCLGSCTQELKMDLGLILDASGSIAPTDYRLQLTFAENLLKRVDVAPNKTHVGIINFSSNFQILTYLNTDYQLNQTIQKLKQATHYKGSTNTALALREANRIFTTEFGLRNPEEGAAQVIFVITDGASDNQARTLEAADAVKSKNIQLISVGVGTDLNPRELAMMCTPPASENYFSILDYAALDSKLNQFISKTCSEPVIVPGNTTVTTEVSKDKYKFLKIQILFTGNKIMIKIKLFNGKVKLFYSFKTKNPKDPAEFINIKPKPKDTVRSLWSKLFDQAQNKAEFSRANDDVVTLVADRPEDLETDFVYVGVKGVEEENKFELNLEDCEQVYCSATTMKFNLFLLVLCSFLVRKFFE